MKAEWDPTGALYINLESDDQEDALEVSATVELDPGVLVDVDSSGRPLGVEVIAPRPDSFALRVLGLVARTDCRDDIWWRTDGSYAPITFWVDCSDVFWWGTADLEPLTEEAFAELEQAYADEREVAGCYIYAASLFCARRRGMRPQGAAYPKDQRLWPLFDACGPARDLGIGNPHPHPVAPS